MILVPVSSNVLGAAFAIAIVAVVGWGLIKLFFGTAGSIIDSVEVSNAKNEDQKRFENILNKLRKNFSEFLQKGNLTYESEISNKNNLDEIKNVINEIFEIEIYNDKHLIGKSFKLLEDELIAQIRVYAKIGGIYD